MKAILETQSVLLIEPRRWFAKLGEFETAMYSNDDGDYAPEMTVDADGIATVSVAGIISTGLPSYAEDFGFADTGRIRNQIEEAASNPAVKAILLNIDSPGGFVTGTPELGCFIAEVAKTKPVFSFTSGMCCSAAYWLAAPSRAIIATPSAEIGSIGVYVAHEDVSGMARAMGIVVSVFRSGKFKGAGVPGTSLSDDQAAEIQAKVDSLAAVFKSWVAEHRPGISDDTMQGQSFMGYQSSNARLVDGITNDMAGAKEIIKSHLTDLMD